MLDKITIESLVREAVERYLVESHSNASPSQSPAKIENYYKPQASNGVFTDGKEACDAAAAALKELEKLSIKDRNRIIEAIRDFTRKQAQTLSKMIVDESHMGVYEDKVIKHMLVADLTPGTEDLKCLSQSGDDGLTLYEQGPYGVIGAVTPVTNPTETILCNAIGMIAAGNTVVFNPHPNAKNVSAYCVKELNKALEAVGAPKNIICLIENPTKESLDAIVSHKKVRLLCGTGGPGLVSALLSSGKKAIGAGAGNPPVIVDETADLKKAAIDIINGAAFDNNLLCIAEKEVFVIDSVADELILHMIQNGAALITKEQTQKLTDLLITNNNDDYAHEKYLMNKSFIGKDVSLLFEQISLRKPDGVKLIICETPGDHPFVLTEMMTPILPIVRCKNIDEAIKLAVVAENGNRHSAHMHSYNSKNISAFAKAVETTIFVNNASSAAGVGYGGEGYCTFTIAGPTGEGVTSAKTFTRSRRCVFSGTLRIV